jgi:hypothetical protein
VPEAEDAHIADQLNGVVKWWTATRIQALTAVAMFVVALLTLLTKD